MIGGIPLRLAGLTGPLYYESSRCCVSSSQGPVTPVGQGGRRELSALSCATVVPVRGVEFA